MRIPTTDTHAPPMTLEEEVTGLFEQLRNPLFRYFLSLGLSVPDGEEVIQEVFLALFRHLKNGKPRDNLRSWIFRVGHNQALKVRRRRHLRHDARPARVEDGAVESNADPGPDPLEQALRNQRQGRLSAVMRALPGRDRACLSLRAEGIRYREIAEILGMSLGAVALSLGRSLAKLSRADGGVRNLWPQPYSTGVWNARVKDALEDRLRSMVCEGRLDLATAQRDLARDWIAAYKKYFGTGVPLVEHAAFLKDRPWE